MTDKHTQFRRTFLKTIRSAAAADGPLSLLGGTHLDPGPAPGATYEQGLLSGNGTIGASALGRPCRVRSAVSLKVTVRGRSVFVRRTGPDLIEFKTEPGATYALTPAGR